jgi:hypothetical protein
VAKLKKAFRMLKKKLPPLASDINIPTSFKLSDDDYQVQYNISAEVKQG